MELVEEDVRIIGRRRRGRGRRRITKGLARVERSAAFRERPGPGEIDGFIARAGALERFPDGRRAGLGNADIGAGHASGRTIGGRHGAFVGEEFQHRSIGGNQRNAVRRAVLDAIAREFEGHRAIARAFIVDHRAVERDGVVRRAVGAIVENERISGQVEACCPCHFDEFTNVTAGVVVMELVDEDDGRGAFDDLAIVGRARGARRRSRPGEVAIGRSRACQLERIADRGRAGFFNADIGAGQAVCRTTNRGETSFIGKEHDHYAIRIDQSEAVGRAILKSVAGQVDRYELIAASQFDPIVKCAVGAVVEVDFPTGQIEHVEIGNLDEFTGIGACIVVVDFVEKYACAGVRNHALTLQIARIGGRQCGPVTAESLRTFLRQMNDLGAAIPRKVEICPISGQFHAYRASPRSRSSRSWNRIARTWPSITPSIFSGRQRRWNASTALCPSVIS